MSLISAIQNNETEKALKLISKTNFLDTYDNNEFTALTWAIHMENKKLALTLIEKGANVNTQLLYGSTALSMAASNNYGDIVDALISKGAMLNTRTVGGDTALIVACCNGHSNIVKTLLANGTNPYIRNNDNKTAYDMSFEYNYISVSHIIDIWQNSPRSLKFFILECIRRNNIDTKNVPRLLLIRNSFEKETGSFRNALKRKLQEINKFTN